MTSWKSRSQCLHSCGIVIRVVAIEKLQKLSGMFTLVKTDAKYRWKYSTGRHFVRKVPKLQNFDQFLPHVCKRMFCWGTISVRAKLTDQNWRENHTRLQSTRTAKRGFLFCGGIIETRIGTQSEHGRTTARNTTFWKGLLIVLHIFSFHWR